ncbi:MAG: hypothetical protein ABIV28_06470 [Longimicrobiales bacterium]
MALHDAIEHYHSLLDDDIAAESQHQLEDQLRRKGLFFGDRPLCSVLRPRFLTAAQYRFLRDRVTALLPAFEKVHERAITDTAFRKQFRLFDWEETLIAEDPGFREPSPVSRLDAFFVHERGGLKFTEYNAETPAAAAYNDILADMFLGLPIMREFLHKYEVRPQPERHNVMHALIDAYQEWAGDRRAKPVVAILDWKEVPTYSEFVITAEYFNAQGIECVIADPRDVEYTNGRLYAAGRPIDLIYKRVLITELVERGGLDHPIIRAVRDRKVCMVNPFRCKILHKKASLAVLSDERNADMFTGSELEAIDMHIPWSRIVENRSTMKGGLKIDLLEYCRSNRDHLVLKPNDEYGGTGIVLGWTVSDDAWSDAINTAILEPTIVQEKIELPSEPYPSMLNGHVQITDRVLDTAPFIFNGAYMDGCLTRLSTEELVNVTAGGGSSLATFVCEPRVGGSA